MNSYLGGILRRKLIQSKEYVEIYGSFRLIMHPHLHFADEQSAFLIESHWTSRSMEAL